MQGRCGLQSNALWKFTSLGGKYIIEAKSKRVLNDKLGNQLNGNPIISMVRHNGYNQKWLVEFIKDGKGAIKIKNFYSDKCLDNSNSLKMGTIYTQWECSEGNQNQIYYLVPPEEAINGLTKLTVAQKIAMTKFKMPTGWINFLGNTGLCLTENGKDKQIIQQKCSKQGTMDNWQFRRVANELYEIVSKSGLVLTNKSSLKDNGNSVIASKARNANNQRWNVIPLPNGKILLRNPEAAKCVDIDGDVKEGANHLIYECASDKNNQMLLIRSFTGLPIDIINKTSLMEKSPNDITRIFKKGDKTCTCKKKKTQKFFYPKDWVNIVGDGNLCLISSTEGGRIIQGDCGEYSDALWKVTRLEKGNYLIVSKSGTAIENENGKTNTMNPIISGKITKALNQRWTFHNIKGRKFMIEQFGTKLCIDILGNAKKGNGYVQNDCLKGNTGEHFRFLTASGKKVPTKKIDKEKQEIEKKIKNEKIEKENQRKKENDLKINRLERKMKGEDLNPVEKKIEKAIKYVTKKIKEEKNPEKIKELEKILSDIKDSRFKGIEEMEKYIVIYKEIIVEVTVEEYLILLTNVKKEIQIAEKNEDNEKVKELKKKEKELNNKITIERKKEIKKIQKIIERLKNKKKGDPKSNQKLKELKKKIKEQKKIIKKERKEKVKETKKEIKKSIKEGKKNKAKKLKKELKIAKKRIIKEKKRNIKRLEKKIVILQKTGKKEIAKKLNQKLEKLNKVIKKVNFKKEQSKKVREVKNTIKKEIKDLVKTGKGEKAKLLENILKDIKKKTKDPKEIEKAQLRATNIVNSTTDTKKIIKNVIPKEYVNIVTGNGMCLHSGKTASHSYCGNGKGLSWKFILIGGNEYQIEAEDGKFLTNKNGLNVKGNEIIIIKQETTGRDESNIWSFKQTNNGQFIIINPATNKCLETSNMSARGPRFTLEDCKFSGSNSYQLYSFDFVVPESLSKIKSDPKLLEISLHWIHIVGSEEFCMKSTSQNSPLEQNKCQNNELELWRLIPMGENEYKFQNKAGFKISVGNDTKHPKSIMSKSTTFNTEKFTIIFKSGKYMIKNNFLDKCIDTYGKPKPYQTYQMFKCKEDEEGQYFKFIKPTTVHLIEEWIQIIGPTFLCLKNIGRGKELVQESCKDEPAFLWKFEIIEGNTFVIKSKMDESVIDLSDGKIFKGNSLIAYQRQDYNTQKWIVRKHKKGRISIKSEASGTCLDAGKMSIGSGFRIWNCSKKHKGQKFRQEYARPSNYILYFRILFFIYIYYF